MTEINEMQAKVIQLGAWRERREAERAGPEAVERLERAISRLDGLLERVTGEAPKPADIRLETEMLAITGAISSGMVDRAAVLAEDLARRLENRTARGS
jgi:hypothetical protein